MNGTHTPTQVQVERPQNDAPKKFGAYGGQFVPETLMPSLALREGLLVGGSGGTGVVASSSPSLVTSRSPC